MSIRAEPVVRADAEKIHLNRDDLAVQFLAAITSRTVDWQ